MQLNDGQFAAMSKLFSSAVISEMARSGRSAKFARLARLSGLADLQGPAALAGCVFQAAFRVLRNEGSRDEYVYKAALIHKVLLGTHSLQTAAMLTEFRVGPCKADVAILNGTSTVYEIKSERDTLCRLARQIEAYSHVFASVNVICSSDHIPGVLESVPAHVGVLQLSRRHQISTIRAAVNDPARTSSTAIFDSVRLEEAKAILQLSGVRLPEVPNIQMGAELRRLFVQLSPEAAQEGMVTVLKRTRNLSPLTHLLSNLPPSLHAAAISTPLRKEDQRRLREAVNTNLIEALAWG